jgi:hypothetical protein
MDFLMMELIGMVLFSIFVFLFISVINHFEKYKEKDFTVEYRPSLNRYYLKVRKKYVYLNRYGRVEFDNDITHDVVFKDTKEEAMQELAKIKALLGIGEKIIYTLKDKEKSYDR